MGFAGVRPGVEWLAPVLSRGGSAVVAARTLVRIWVVALRRAVVATRTIATRTLGRAALALLGPFAAVIRVTRGRAILARAVSPKGIASGRVLAMARPVVPALIAVL